MNVVYIIGNGFDLRLGLPTSYPDFLNYYMSQKTYSSKINNVKSLFLKKMVEKESKGESDWRDLEVALGQFTEEFNDKILFQNFYLDINRSLTKYLKEVEKYCWKTPTADESQKFFQDLIYPYNYLNPRKRREILSRFTSGGMITDIISFNYTNTIKTLLSKEWAMSKHYQNNDLQDTFYLRSIKHIHHTLLDSGVLFGVNDSSQIKNDVFQKDEDILDLIVKPKGNEEHGSLVDEECRILIEQALLICIFGTSLGQTDKYWWDCIRDRFNQERRLTILFFDYQMSLSEIINTQKGSQERKSRQKVIKALGLEGEEIELRNRIYIAHNTDMFPTRPKKDLDVEKVFNESE